VRETILARETIPVRVTSLFSFKPRQMQAKTTILARETTPVRVTSLFSFKPRQVQAKTSASQDNNSRA
jgi:hypothetical protein